MFRAELRAERVQNYFLLILSLMFSSYLLLSVDSGDLLTITTLRSLF